VLLTMPMKGANFGLSSDSAMATTFRDTSDGGVN